jgi:hypothetical protein
VATAEKVYAETPASVSVETGSMTVQVPAMKVTEQLEKPSGSVVSPAKLTGRIVLIEGKIWFIDAHGKAIEMDEKRIEPAIKPASVDRGP